MRSTSFLRTLWSAAANKSGVVSTHAAAAVPLYNVRWMSNDSGKFLVEEEKYAFLKELGLDKVNDGVYNGKWFGSGEVSFLGSIRDGLG